MGWRYQQVTAVALNRGLHSPPGRGVAPRRRAIPVERTISRRGGNPQQGAISRRGAGEGGCCAHRPVSEGLATSSRMTGWLEAKKSITAANTCGLMVGHPASSS